MCRYYYRNKKMKKKNQKINYTWVRKTNFSLAIFKRKIRKKLNKKKLVFQLVCALVCVGINVFVYVGNFNIIFFASFYYYLIFHTQNFFFSFYLSSSCCFSSIFFASFSPIPISKIDFLTLRYSFSFYSLFLRFLYFFSHNIFILAWDANITNNQM